MLVRLVGGWSPTDNIACRMSVNPEDVSTLTEHGEWTLVKMRNGDSFYVKGSYDAVDKALRIASQRDQKRNKCS